MPDAFLFDIGNVIITFDFTKATRKMQPHLSVGVEEAILLIAPLTRELELGRLTPLSFIEAASERIGYTGEHDFFRSAFEDIFELNLPMVRFIEEKKAEGLPLYLLSNTNGIHVPFFEKTYPIFELFDGRIYSHEVGLMKPDPAIYELTRGALPIDPRRTVYIDDLPENCAAGSAAGFLSVPYAASRHEDFLEAVEKICVW